MPPKHELLTDDYVAEVLAKEAADCSLKYSAMGLEAFNQPAKYVLLQPQRPNMPIMFADHVTFAGVQRTNPSPILAS